MRPPLSRRWLRAEFATLYLFAPVALAVFLPPSAMFPALFAVTALGLVLLHLTPGFHWRELFRGAGRIGWGRVAAVAVATAALGYAVVQATSPGSFLALPRRNPQLMLMIATLYPLLSALPQEIVFRPLFFRRYGSLLPDGRGAQIVLNAAIFSFAHLMYWSWIVAAMTFAGGLAFAWSYRAKGNFPEAVVSHSIAGIILFALGLGVFFYSGNVERPF
jgi:membrane protease YdiL (CAAX protease family)